MHCSTICVACYNWSSFSFKMCAFWVFYNCVLTSIECDISDSCNAFSVFIKTEEYSQWLPCGQICWLFFTQFMYQKKKVILSCKIFCCSLADFGCTQSKCIFVEWICRGFLTVYTCDNVSFCWI